ncbi:DUF3080 domain-containing protein [Halomonas organivorans]
MARWKFRLKGLLMATLALLSGCGDGPAEVLLGDYQRRLAETLDLAAPSPRSPANIGAFPGRDARLFSVPETREGFLDVFALRGCHIANLVAERNNQLGRVAAPSQRWLYELSLWRRLSGCWNTEVPATLDETGRARLARLTRTKTEQLPRASWNALFDSSEWVGSFSRASTPLAPDELDAVDEQLPVLAYLREATLHQFDRRWPPDSATLEGHLQTLQTRPLTAELLRALMLAAQRLREASDLLQAELARAGSCPVELAGLTNSVEDRRLAAWLPRLEDGARRWLTAIGHLLDAHPVNVPPAVTAYRRRWLSLEAPEAPWPALVAARQHHEALRESLAQRCR